MFASPCTIVGQGRQLRASGWEHCTSCAPRQTVRARPASCPNIYNANQNSPTATQKLGSPQACRNRRVLTRTWSFTELAEDEPATTFAIPFSTSPDLLVVKSKTTSLHRPTRLQTVPSAAKGHAGVLTSEASRQVQQPHTTRPCPTSRCTQPTTLAMPGPAMMAQVVRESALPTAA